MKKISLVLVIFILCTSVFADNVWGSVKGAFNKIKENVQDAGDSLAYFKNCDDRKNHEFFEKENTHLLNVLYVSSVNGTNVRIEPDAKSQMICAVPFNMPLRPVKLMQKTTVNNIESYWVKVYIPLYLQKEAGSEYGYVFGGYLSHTQNDLTKLPENWSRKALENLLMSAAWKSSDSGIITYFGRDGKYFTEANLFETTDTWACTDKNEVQITKGKTSTSYKVRVIDAWTIQLGNEKYDAVADLFFPEQPQAYFVDRNGRNLLWFFSMNFKHKDAIMAERFISIGLDAENTKYLGEYRNYWKKITGEYIPYKDESVNSSYNKKIEKIYFDKYIRENEEIAIGDLDYDGENEKIVPYEENGYILFRLYDENDSYQRDLVAKDKINKENNVKYTYETGLAVNLEQPVAYLVVRCDTPTVVKAYFYTIKDNQLNLICMQEHNKSSERKCFFNFYFTQNNLETYFVFEDSKNCFSYSEPVVYTQDVSDVSVFKKQKKIIKK